MRRIVTGLDPLNPSNPRLKRGWPGQAVILIKVDAWDDNCPQHITPRFSEAELEPRLGGLHIRIAELEAEVETLRRKSTSQKLGRFPVTERPI